MPTGPDPYTESGAVSIPAEYDRLVVRMRHPEGVRNRAQLFFVTSADLGYSESKSVLFDVLGTGDFVDYELDLSGVPGWRETILALRLDPVEDGATPTDVDRIWFPTTGG